MFWNLQNNSDDKHVLKIREAVKALYEELHGNDPGFEWAYPVEDLVDSDFQIYDEIGRINAEEINYAPAKDELTFPIKEHGTMVMSLKEFYDMGGELEMHIDYGWAEVVGVEGLSVFVVFHFLTPAKIKKCRAKRMKELKALNRIYAQHHWELIKIV